MQRDGVVVCMADIKNNEYLTFHSKVTKGGLEVQSRGALSPRVYWRGDGIVIP